jgi:hypothetical protein
VAEGAAGNREEGVIKKQHIVAATEFRNISRKERKGRKGKKLISELCVLGARGASNIRMRSNGVHHVTEQ